MVQQRRGNRTNKIRLDFRVNKILRFIELYNSYIKIKDLSIEKKELAREIFILYEMNRWLMHIPDVSRIPIKYLNKNQIEIINEWIKLVQNAELTFSELTDKVKETIGSYLYQNKIQSDLRTVVNYVTNNELDLLHVFLELEYLKKNPDRNKLSRENSSNWKRYFAVDAGLDFLGWIMFR